MLHLRLHGLFVFFGIALTGAMLVPTQTAMAGTAKAISEIKLSAQYDGDLRMFSRADLTDGTSHKSGFGIHEETVSELVSFPENLWELKIAASAFAVSPPTSQSLASFTEASGNIFWLFNDPALGLGDQTVKVTMAAVTSLYAYAEGDYAKAIAAASYSLNGRGTANDMPIMSLSPPFKFKITFPSVDGFNYAEEIAKTFVMHPGDHFVVSLGSATVAAAAYTSEVPEPATWATMFAGFALAGGAMRHRRRQSA